MIALHKLIYFLLASECSVVRGGKQPCFPLQVLTTLRALHCNQAYQQRWFRSTAKKESAHWRSF